MESEQKDNNNNTVVRSQLGYCPSLNLTLKYYLNKKKKKQKLIESHLICYKFSETTRRPIMEAKNNSIDYPEKKI